MTKPLAIAYVRVSTADQAEHGASLDAQETALRDEATRRGWDIEIVREEGKSAKSMTNRPKLIETIKRLNRGDAQVLLALRLDRISRSVSDFSQLMAQSQKRGWEIVVSGSAIDTTSAGGKFSAHVMSAAAEFERDLISTRTREGMAQRKSEGVVFGRSVAAEFLPVYERVIALHKDGKSFSQIAAQMTADGVATARGGAWAPMTVRRIVNSETAKQLA
jgi:DNA invertase Pin-like site-specific DNA recombinase